MAAREPEDERTEKHAGGGQQLHEDRLDRIESAYLPVLGDEVTDRVAGGRQGQSLGALRFTPSPVFEQALRQSIQSWSAAGPIL